MVFQYNLSKIISLSIILCLFIHNSRSKHSRKTTASELHKQNFCEMSANNCFQFCPSLWATVDFLFLKVFNSNNLLSKAVVFLTLFYLKSCQKNSFVHSSKRPNLYTSQPQNLCHTLKHVWLFVFFFHYRWSLVREWNIKVF